MIKVVAAHFEVLAQGSVSAKEGDEQTESKHRDAYDEEQFIVDDRIDFWVELLQPLHTEVDEHVCQDCRHDA